MMTFLAGSVVGIMVGIALGNLRTVTSSKLTILPQSADVLSAVQREAWEWTKLNFPGQVPWQPLMGVVEEVGELAHAYLKATQNIRGPKFAHHEAMIDAVGDQMIFLVNFCSHLGIDAAEALRSTWMEVKHRDWQANPTTGNINVKVEK